MIVLDTGQVLSPAATQSQFYVPPVEQTSPAKSWVSTASKTGDIWCCSFVERAFCIL